LRVHDASAAFLSALDGVEDPEEKRRRIGHAFVRAFEVATAGLPKVRYLAQGTLYPDVIESSAHGGHSKTIKTHHNVGGLPADMEFELLEPLRDLFKDEVRVLGAELGLPAKALIRRKEAASSGIDPEALSEEALIRAMAEHPIIVERPIVVANGKAALGRPPEKVLDVL